MLALHSSLVAWHGVRDLRFVDFWVLPSLDIRSTQRASVCRAPSRPADRAKHDSMFELGLHERALLRPARHTE